MDFSWESSGGLAIAGQGEYQLLPGDDCRLVLNARGLQNTLDAGRKAFENKYKVGLFQNDFKPRVSMLLADLQICNFSGYPGLLVSFGWTIPDYAGGFATTTANELTWDHSGGPVGNFVYGYYVVDSAGALVWAERFCPAPMRVYRLGERVRVRPTMYLVNDLLV